MTLERGSLPRAGIAVGLAALVHASAFAWALQSLQRPGAISRQTAAISLNLVETLVVEAPAARETPATSAANIEAVARPHPADRAKAAREKNEAEAEASEKTRLEARRDAENIPLRADRKTAPPAVRARELETKTVEIADPPAGVQKEVAVRPRNTNRQPPAGKPAADKNARPAKSRERALARRSDGRLSASAGNIIDYGASVRSRIAEKRPESRGVRGTVIVAFAISKSGALRYARIDGSSGNMVLDRAALAAVRRAAPFPSPPKGMSLRQLSYTLPFRFK